MRGRDDRDVAGDVCPGRRGRARRRRPTASRACRSSSGPGVAVSVTDFRLRRRVPARELEVHEHQRLLVFFATDAERDAVAAEAARRRESSGHRRHFIPIPSLSDLVRTYVAMSLRPNPSIHGLPRVGAVRALPDWARARLRAVGRDRPERQARAAAHRSERLGGQRRPTAAPELPAASDQPAARVPAARRHDGQRGDERRRRGNGRRTAAGGGGGRRARPAARAAAAAADRRRGAAARAAPAAPAGTGGGAAGSGAAVARWTTRQRRHAARPTARS